jgi:hypothetical protein
MAKIQQKSEKISAFGGIFFVLDILGHSGTDPLCPENYDEKKIPPESQ